MSRRILLAITPVVLAAGLALSACGSSNSSSSNNNNGGGGSVNVGNGSFCDQTKSAIAQIEQLSKSFVPATAGATPDVASFKTLIANVTSAIDQLDGNAPGEISSAFHTLRTAYDQANTQVQTATTLEQIGNAFSTVDTDQVKAASDQISKYLQNSCGINPSASP